MTVSKGGLDGIECGMVDWLEQWFGAFILRCSRGRGIMVTVIV